MKKTNQRVNIKELKNKTKNAMRIIMSCYTFIIPLIILIVMEFFIFNEVQMTHINILVACVVFLCLNFYSAIKFIIEFKDIFKLDE